MKAYTESERQALIAKCKKDIAEMRSWRDGDDYSADVEIFEIALAALEAPPIHQMSKRPGIWIGATDRRVERNLIHGYQSRIVYSAPPVPALKPAVQPQRFKQRNGHDISGIRPVMIPDDNGDWLYVLDVEQMLRMAGVAFNEESAP